MSNIAERAKEAAEKLKRSKMKNQKELYLSAKIYQDESVDGSIGFIKIFTNYELAVEDGEGKEPIPFGTMTLE